MRRKMTPTGKTLQEKNGYSLEETESAVLMLL